ncbi:MAG: FliH/SctL family protein [Alphaproteobacteria bacterium]
MLQRFDQQFLRDFRTPVAVKAAAPVAVEEAIAPPPPPPPVFSEAELAAARDAAKQLGYAEGVEAGLAQAATEEAARRKDLTEAGQRIAGQLAQLAGTYSQLIAQQSVELSALVVAIARKVAGEALDARGVDTIAALVKSCLPVVYGRPRVTIELHPDLLDDARDAIRPLIEASGLESEIAFKGSETLARHDVRVDWGNGQAHRSGDAIWREIEALLGQVPLVPDMTQPSHPTEQPHG